MLCNMLGCNTEDYAKVLFYYFDKGMKKPFCKETMRFCWNHVKQIASEDVDVRIKVLH